ncbi:hypothetical protein [Streptomyces noursei]|uniref:hypothetical protein n=1 Tax=Streptomyces noursei TaxID=1971 RepID=UPI000383EDA9|nr:hypothetical protein [Streptomyces noursei]EPY92111.1 hypothetical protein K530_55045 [Streptomyces noursei CCRC 11814]MCZ0970759.1 hypothetical protein [Streptomyces noursei]
MGTSYEELRPLERDVERERGRRATPARTAGVVINSVLVTTEGPWDGWWRVAV